MVEAHTSLAVLCNQKRGENIPHHKQRRGTISTVTNRAVKFKPVPTASTDPILPKISHFYPFKHDFQARSHPVPRVYCPQEGRWPLQRLEPNGEGFWMARRGPNSTWNWADAVCARWPEARRLQNTMSPLHPSIYTNEE